MTLPSSTPPALSDAEVQALGGAGFFVREALVGDQAALAARAEAETLLEAGQLQPAAVSRGAARQIDSSIRGDRKAWLSDAQLGPALGFARDALVALGEQVGAAAYLGLQRHDVQLAHYERGAAYVRHRDAFRGGESRRLTAITYLNPDWQPEHGGVLRLYPIDGAPPIDLEPRLDRVVVFLADAVEHEVLPSFASRFALTAWFYSTPA